MGKDKKRYVHVCMSCDQLKLTYSFCRKRGENLELREFYFATKPDSAQRSIPAPASVRNKTSFATLT